MRPSVCSWIIANRTAGKYEISCNRSNFSSRPLHASASAAARFRFANKMHSTAGGAIEKARRVNTVKATIIVRDTENFSSVTAMYSRNDFTFSNVFSLSHPAFLSLSFSFFYVYVDNLSLFFSSSLSCFSTPLKMFHRPTINCQFKRLYKLGSEIFFRPPFKLFKRLRTTGTLFRKKLRFHRPVGREISFKISFERNATRLVSRATLRSF